jgi:hypothetical protein
MKGKYRRKHLWLVLGPEFVVRIRSDRKFFTRPVPRRPGQNGRPRRYGDRLLCADPATWPPPDASHACDEVRYGRVQAQAWHRLHPTSAPTATRAER